MGRLADFLNALQRIFTKGANTWYVNGNLTSSDGTSWESAFATIQEAIDAASANDSILVAPKLIPVAEELGGPGTDPNSYAETLIIPNTKPNLAIIGISTGRTQGGMPQIKKGSGTTALLTIRAAGCLISNLGFNGNGSTGGGILLDDDGGLTKTAFGTTIESCHFKNCRGSNATNAATGGAIQWSSNGGAFQTRIKDCRFYKNVGDIVLLGTGASVPQDVVIEDCVFSNIAADKDCNLFLAGGSGMNGVIIRRCSFGQKPALGGTNDKYFVATGCIGTLEDCTFACQTSHTGGTKITFKSNGTGATIPTTLHIIRCFGQSIKENESGEITIAA